VVLYCLRLKGGEPLRCCDGSLATRELGRPGRMGRNDAPRSRAAVASTALRSLAWPQDRPRPSHDEVQRRCLGKSGSGNSGTVALSGTGTSRGQAENRAWLFRYWARVLKKPPRRMLTRMGRSSTGRISSRLGQGDPHPNTTESLHASLGRARRLPQGAYRRPHLVAPGSA
jgi:hypothetical protein